MFEISRVNASKGVFEWALEGFMPKPISWIGRLGQTRVKLLSLSLILLALFLSFQNRMAFWLFNTFEMTSLTAESLQLGVKWTLAGLGLVIWTLGFLFRKPKAVLLMNRPQGILQLREFPIWRIVPDREFTFKFEDVENIEVYAPAKAPPTPYGHIRMSFRGDSKASSKKIAFRVLSEEQFRFFPTNLYRITGKEPVGDWSEEDKAFDESSLETNPMKH
jgi:hypothetical protein